MWTVNSLLQDSNFLYHLHTLFLFTKADIRTALIPQTVFALAAAPVCHLSHVIHVVAWIWLHLLTCNIANQVKAPEEDKINKPFRPLPSGRITEHHARMLRWILVPVCLAVSAAYSTELFLISLELQLLTVLYSELHGDTRFILKNSLTAVMYGCAGLGGALLAVCDRSHVSKTAQLAVQLSTAAFASTLHAQDFKDVSGDRLTGRSTLPIIFPFCSRLSVALGIPLWSIYLSRVWHLDPFSATVFVSYSGYTGVRFLLHRSVDDDKRSCKFYSHSSRTSCILAYLRGGQQPLVAYIILIVPSFVVFFLVTHFADTLQRRKVTQIINHNPTLGSTRGLVSSHKPLQKPRV